MPDIFIGDTEHKEESEKTTKDSGKKVETKAKFIDNISEVADYVIVSGLIAKEISEKNIKFL